MQALNACDLIKILKVSEADEISWCPFVKNYISVIIDMPFVIGQVFYFPQDQNTSCQKIVLLKLMSNESDIGQDISSVKKP